MTSLSRHHRLLDLLTPYGFGEEGAAELADIGIWREFSPGEDLLSFDLPAPWLALIETGEVEFFVEVPGRSQRLVVASLRPGATLGWELLTGQIICAFGARTTHYSRLLTLSPDSITALLNRNPETAIRLADAALQTMHDVQHSVLYE